MLVTHNRNHVIEAYMYILIQGIRQDVQQWLFFWMSHMCDTHCKWVNMDQKSMTNDDLMSRDRQYPIGIHHKRVLCRGKL